MNDANGTSLPQPSPDSPAAKAFEPLYLNKYAVAGLAFVGIIAFVPFIAFFFTPIVVAATLAALFYPLYNWVYALLWRKPVLASVVCCMLLVICILIPVYILIQLVINQAITFYTAAAPTFKDIMREGPNAEIFNQLGQTRIGSWLLNNVNWQKVLNDIEKSLTTLGTIIANRTYAGVFGLITNLIITLFILFYFFFDGERILKAFKYLLPVRLEYKDRIASSFRLISGATVKGILIIGLLQGILGALTLLIFGVKSWLLWGFVTLFFSIIPMLGSPVVLVPAGLIQIFLGHIWQGIGIIVVDLVVISSVDNILRPRLVGSGAKIHDLLVFISTLGGLSLFGILGVIVGPAIASFFVAVMDIYKTEYTQQLDTLNSRTSPRREI